jgi:hypothetical protein
MQLASRRVLILALLLAIVLFYGLRAGFLFLIATDPDTGPLKVDFLSYYSGSWFALEGEPAAAYDAGRLYEYQLELHKDESGSYAWLYPPPFFFFVLPLALMSVVVAIVFWIAGTGVLVLSAVRRISHDNLVFLLAIAFPATLWNSVTGQNGLLTAGLLAWGVLLLRERPLLAGVVLGLLVYKPQFFPLIPLALIAGGHRQAAAASVGVAVALCLGSLVAFGMDSWEGFFDAASSRGDLIYAGEGALQKMQSITGVLLALGGSPFLAQLLQALVFLVSAAFIVWLWGGHAVIEYKAAGLAMAILLASPYSYHYDLTLLGLAAIWMAVRFQADGWRKGDRAVLVVVWLTPLLTLIVGRLIGVSLGPLVMLMLVAVLLQRIAAIRDLSSTNSPGIAAI